MIQPCPEDSSLNAEPTRVLKHGDTFAVLNLQGNIRSRPHGEEGLYHDGTRFLSELILHLEFAPPLLLSSAIRDDNDQFNASFTNPTLCNDAGIRLPLGALHLSSKLLLWEGALYQQLQIENHDSQPAAVTVTLHFAADFSDIYEVRGMKRIARGHILPSERTAQEIALSYQGLDNVLRQTLLQFTPAPSLLTSSQAHFQLTLEPRATRTMQVCVQCRSRSRNPKPQRTAPLLSFQQAQTALHSAVRAQQSQSCRIESSNSQFTAWAARATADLGMMVSQLPTGPYPYAGVPWFNTPFGRDGIITALESLSIQPSLAHGVLSYLAATQATELIPEQDAEPGKILHETRNGEMAALREMPFARYYGSVDVTPLFVHLACAYYERTADLSFIQSIWPNLLAALNWMAEYGDRDQDCFLEYSRQTNLGLMHQGWKDSDEAIFHANGKPAQGSIALCEVQAYAYAAWKAGAALATALNLPEHAHTYTARAAELQTRFEEAFWCPSLQTYALALDGEKRACEVRTSNAGQCLFSGIAHPDRARQVALTLLAPESFNGWGIRTVASSEARYNPMSYHNGSIWPHDNALIAHGFSRYNLADAVSRVFTGLFQSATYFERYRLPELFCGFDRIPGEAPILYPVACSPQAWSSASVFLLLESCLGMNINALESRITLRHPLLPPFIDHVAIHGLRVGASTLSLALTRHGQSVAAEIFNTQGEVELVIQ